MTYALLACLVRGAQCVCKSVSVCALLEFEARIASTERSKVKNGTNRDACRGLRVALFSTTRVQSLWWCTGQGRL